MSIYRNRRSIHGKPYTPFFYVIGWRELDRWYIGSRTRQCSGQTAHPDELMVTYFTSSNYVHAFIPDHGMPDVVWTFPCKTAADAIYHEKRIMCEFAHFLKDDRWINKGQHGAIHFDDEVRSKISGALKGKMVGDRNPFYGKQHSDETRAKMREAWKTRAPASEETRQKMSESSKLRTRRKMTQAEKDKLSRKKTRLFIHWNGTDYSLKQFSHLTGLGIDCIKWRIREGWGADRIANTPRNGSRVKQSAT